MDAKYLKTIDNIINIIIDSNYIVVIFYKVY